MKQNNQSNENTAKGSAGIIVFAVIFYFSCGGSDDSDRNKEENALTRQERIEAQFSAWNNGEHKNLAELIKQGMNDPDSYENLKTTYFDMDSFIVVNQEYTGKNAFGGRVRGFAKAKIDTLGNIIEVLDNY